MQEVSQVLIPKEQIEARLRELGEEITEDYRGEELIVLCVLNGAFIYCSDLIKKIDLPVKVDFVSLSSYGGGTESSGEVIVQMDCQLDVRDRNILIVEDIVDTGLTMKSFMKMLVERGPKSVRLTSLLYKPSRNIHPTKIDYLGFEIEDKFVVGYGLDYAGRYRELPYIGVLNADN